MSVWRDTPEAAASGVFSLIKVHIMRRRKMDAGAA